MKLASSLVMTFLVAITWLGGTSADCLAEKLRVVESENTIVVQDGDQSILTYNKVSPPVPKGLKGVYERSGCLHPVCSPSGQSVTAMFAKDHPHQQGIFAAWVKTTYQDETIDFWNLGGGTGRVLHEQVVSTFQEDDRAGFEVDLIHRKETEPKADVLRERWKVTAYPTDGSYRMFDLESTQSSITTHPLVINEYHYGGFAVRGPARWVTDSKDKDELEPSGFLNSEGSKRAKGNHQHAKWVSLWGEIDGKPVSITVLSDPQNFRAPQAARIHPTKPYFCFAPCVDGEFVIDGDHPYKARYRYLVTDAMPDPKWLDQQWEKWSSESTDKGGSTR
ncbi:hypothetical protein Pan97_27960 [Bremerella volcania]|uniref:Methane oxygenase PmoA n=1 Tax=Bremerella volcania TaxID=2527984 RepID=A0A518C987_9BACT|nr:PmoA family protein [Bremerella volcania]QDU75754.1 hypothetical protein Pan97_27960 [Bremerella volcania]